MQMGERARDVWQHCDGVLVVSLALSLPFAQGEEGAGSRECATRKKERVGDADDKADAHKDA